MTGAQLYGRGFAFPPKVGPDGRTAMSEGELNISESIRVILLTEPNERVYMPDFGAGLSRYLFEPNTVATRYQIQEQIKRALDKWEPRIQLTDVQVDEDPRDAQGVIATIVYRLVATQKQQQTALSLRLAG